MNLINGFDNFSERFEQICSSKEWIFVKKILISQIESNIGNGGNVPVCDHGNLHMGLSNKSAKAPGSGILKNSKMTPHMIYGSKIGLAIEIRGLDDLSLSKSMVIGNIQNLDILKIFALL